MGLFSSLSEPSRVFFLRTTGFLLQDSCDPIEDLDVVEDFRNTLDEEADDGGVGGSDSTFLFSL